MFVLFMAMAWAPTGASSQPRAQGGDEQSSGHEKQAAQPRHAPPQGRQGSAQPRQNPPPKPPQNPPPARHPHDSTPHEGYPPQAVPRSGPPAGNAQTARPRPSPDPHHPPSVHHPPGQMWRAYPEPRFYGYARPRVLVPCIAYPQPYYTFWPRFWIGFGIYIGVPVPYPVIYGYPPYVYGDGVIYATPTDSSRFGGIAFTITPDDAVVAVDGVEVGLARDFSSNRQPLTLTPGPHHIELQAPGRVPLAFDVDTRPGEVLPFKGTLQLG